MTFKDMMLNDLGSILSDTGNSIRYNGYNTFGNLFYDPTESLQLNNKAYSVSDNELTLTIASGSIGTISNNTNITVDNTTYLIKKFIFLSDGMETKLWLAGAN